MNHLPPDQRRLTTGVVGLDRVLQGGLIRCGSYLIAGASGTGKTVLSSQIAFHRASLGEHVLFISVLSESYAHLLDNVSNFTFYEGGSLNERFSFLSAYGTLEEAGLPGFDVELRRVITSSKPSLVVIDGIGLLESFAEKQRDYRAYLRKLIALCAMSGATLLAITDRQAAAAAPEYNAADAVCELGRAVVGMRSARTLEIVKSRGSAHLEGRHFFEIEREGVLVFPRTEVAWQSIEAPSATTEPLHMGISGLDDMLASGLTCGSTTAVVGASGVGKTLLGMSFLAEGLRRGERALYFGFHEGPDRLLQAASGIGLSVRDAVRSGQLRMVWRPAGEYLLDRLGDEMLALVHEHRPTRLVLDGIDGMRVAAALPERVPRFLAVLTNTLRTRGVTTVVTEETGLIGADVLPRYALSPSFENLLLLRYVELRSRLHRVVSVLKTRDGAHDPSLREYDITDCGFQIGGIFESTQQILGGLARVIPGEEAGTLGAPP